MANVDLAEPRSGSVSCRGTSQDVGGETNMAATQAIRDSVLQTIGNTPVVRLRKIVTPAMADVLVKL